MSGRLKAPEDRARNHPLYKTYRNMRARCEDPKHISYPNYGARGIRVCDRWRKFQNFADDMGTRPEGASLERIDNQGPYEPANCRWATEHEQHRNTKRNVFLTVNGERLCQKDWARRLGCSKATLLRHMRQDGLEGAQAWIAGRLNDSTQKGIDHG